MKRTRRGVSQAAPVSGPRAGVVRAASKQDARLDSALGRIHANYGGDLAEFFRRLQEQMARTHSTAKQLPLDLDKTLRP